MLRAKAVKNPQRRHPLARQGVEFDRSGRQDRGHPGHRRSRQRGQPQLPGTQNARCRARRAPRGTRAAVPVEHSAQASSARRSAPPAAARAAGDDARQGGAVRHLLRQSQRTARSDSIWCACSSTTASKSRWPSGRTAAACPSSSSAIWRPSRDLKAKNVPPLLAMIERGYDIVAPIPSCVLMFKQELPLMFPDDADVATIKRHIFDPFEYLALRHKAGLMRTDFPRPLGKIAYHVACHLRVQNIGLKTRDILQLDPRHHRRADRTMFGSQRHLRSEARISRHLDEDRQAGDAAGAGERRRLLRERLSDGGPSDRKRPGPTGRRRRIP